MLLSPPKTDDENNATSGYVAGEEFHDMDMDALVLKLG